MARQTTINVKVNSTSAVKSIDTLKKAFEGLNETVKKTVGTDNKIKIDVDLGGIDIATLGKISHGFKKMSISLDRLNNSAKKYSQNGIIFENTNTGISISSNKVTKDVDNLSKKLVASAIAFEMWKKGFSWLTSTYSELSSSTFDIGIADQMTISQIDKLNTSFIGLSTTVPHTASALANSVSDLIRTGRSFDESRKIIEQVAILSTASGDSLKDTAQVVTKVMTALDVSADKTVDTLNAMHSTAIRTASDMGYLAESFKNVAGTASVLVKSSGLSGQALDEYKQEVLNLTLSISGAMANMGLGASSAGTKIKNMFSKLTAMEKTAKNLFDTAMRVNDIKIDGELLDSEKLSQMAQKDLPATVELLSKLYTEGKLSSTVMQKMFTGRHFMEIAEILSQINGNVDTFVEGIATGVNYSQDFYKSMFKLTEQSKLLKNNIINMSQSGMMPLGKMLTGSMMVINDSVNGTKKMNQELKNVVQTTVSLGLVAGTVNTSFGALTKTIAPLLSGFVSTSPIGLAVTGISVALAYLSKEYYEAKKSFADTNILLDNIKLIQSDINKELINTKAHLTNIKNIVNSIDTMDLGLTPANDMLTLLTKKFGTFQDMVSSVGEIKSIDKLGIEFYSDRYERELEALNDITNKKIDDFDSIIKESIESIYSTKIGQRVIQVGLKDEMKEFLDYYLELKKSGEDINKINEKLYAKGKDLGFGGKTTVHQIIGELGKTKLDGFIDELKKVQKNYQDNAEAMKKSFSGVLEQITDLQEAHSKLNSELANARVELFNLTGTYSKVSKDGKTIQEFTGLEGFIELFKSSMLESSSTVITNLKIELDKLNEQYEHINKRKEEGKKYSKEELIDIKSKIDITSKNIEKEESYYKSRESYLKDINSQLLDGIDYNKKTQEWIYKILSDELLIKELRERNPSLFKNEIERLEALQKTHIQIGKIITDNIRAEEQKTTYQIKYRNYLKETLDVELESVKLGKTKAEQEFLSYTYKIKQLEAEQKIASSEKEVAKHALDNSKISKEWMDRVSKISDSESGQDVINDFYEKYKNILKGSEGKEQKEFYEALTTYVSAMSKEEALGKKISLEPLKAINEFLLGVPEAIQESLMGLQELANEGIIPFNNYGDRLVEQIEKQMSSNKERIWKAYGLDAKSLQEAIEKNMAQINLFDTMSTDDTFILSEFQKLRDKFSGNEEITKEIIALEKKGASVVEKKAFMMKLLNAEQDDLLNQKNLELALDKKSLENLKSKVKYLNSMGKLASSIGDIFGSDDISNFGKAFEGIGDFQVNMENLGSIDWSKALDFNTEELSKAFEGLFAGLQMGSTIGTAVGGITGGGQASQQGGALGGLLATGLGMTGWGAVGMAVGGSVLGGLFGDDGDDQAEAERRTKEANKIYNKNTEALQKLAQNMSNLSGGVDSLNNTLISAFSKIPTVDNISNVTDAMTQMYKTMDKTRRFEDVAYQVTKTKKSKGGLFGGGSTTSWTETIEVSVNEMLRRYGFKGALEDMTTQQIRDFSAWLDNYDLGDTDNFSILADALEDYAEGLDKFETNIQNFFRDTTMEAFSGISSLEQESLRQQIEDFYKNLGFQIDDEISKQIDKLAEEMSVMVTIMSDVRGEFVNQWRLTGQSAGSVFLKSMTPYLDAMMENISQVYYDVYFSGVNENLEKEFKNLSEQLIELKREGKDLDWSSVTDKLSDSFGNVLNTIISVRDETTSFNDILMELQKQALESGLSLSEIFDLGLMSGTQQDVMETFKDALLGGESDSALTSIGEMLGDKIGETMANRMIDNLLSDNILEFSAQIDKIMSGGLSFDSLAELSNQALSVGLMMQGEADRLSAIKELFDFQSDIEYTTQNENIEYQTGTSSQQVYNVYVNGTIEAGNIIESDSTERLLQAIIDDLIERLRVDKGIDITKLR